MNPVRAWFAYLILVLASGATVAPGIWYGVHLFWPDSMIAAQPFHRYVHRSLLVIAIAGLWPLNQTSCFPRGFGIRWGRFPIQRLGVGWLIGFASLGMVAVVSMIFDQRHLNVSVSRAIWLTELFKALSTALVVGLMEELLFRGALFTSLRHRHNWLLAATLSSAIYALVHFFQRPPEPLDVTLWSGWFILGHMLSGFWEWPTLVPGFFNLFLVGWILAVARERSGGLAASIGLHGAWIFWLKLYAFLTTPTQDVDKSFWGSAKMIDGWLAFLVLAITLCFVHRLSVLEQIKPDPEPQ